MRCALACVVVAAIGVPASAHIKLDSPSPRTDALKAGPCGAPGSTRGTNISTFLPGQTITVEWDETVDHPGHYRISFDASGTDAFPDPVQPDDSFPTTLVDQIADKNGGHYTQDVTLPNMECDNCTLQLVQVMTVSVPYNSFYFQCADLVLSADAGSGSGSDGGSDSSSGGCSAAPGGAGAGVMIAFAALVARRRRRV
jgi:uncharacterized protein (TIGR03382 family)